MAEKITSIDGYNQAQSAEDRAICERLRGIIDRSLPDADSRIWHAHPVWFLAGNPIVGYSKLKTCIRLLFWSGQSFPTPGLAVEGTFKAAEKRYTDPAQIEEDALKLWLGDARTIQWDYKSLVRNKGRLERLL